MHDTLINNNLIGFNNKIVNYKNILENMLNIDLYYHEGNGLDCHRTWEIILLGSIVITETSSLDNMYIQNNLPVIILNNYDELTVLLQKN